MYELTSYLAGDWVRGSGSERPIFNPSTEEKLGSVAGGALDMAAAYSFALEKGVPALASLCFAERGELLKALSKKLYEHRDELIDLAIVNGGNTRGDAKFDIDGATGTLAYYGQLGKSLGDRRFLSDGEGEALGRSPRFFGQHLFTTRRGLAVHVNAFNFPAWGMGEKMACALLAGVPVLEKAGTPSALLAWRMAEIIVDSGILPEGCFQFVTGPLGDLFDHLGAMDHVAFTGSAVTGHKIRGHASMLQKQVRVNIEADSINSAVLGPDVEEDSETWDLFVSMVSGEITQKAGQKCTAIRRIFVPEKIKGAVCEALAERLQKVKVGDPADDDVRMGPVASQSQDDEVRSGMQLLLQHARAVCGGPEPLRDKGYFFAPTLLEAANAKTDLLHSLEVFGPCSTVIPYSGESAEAVSLVNRGGGSLVSSLYSDDKAWSAEMILGISPWHGRVWIGSEKVAGKATPPGAVLPMSVHGGPGRAGGGEELGGLRGLAFYMQRSSLQGDQGLLAREFGLAKNAD
ncbi:MAG: aldehyde dehydrogenase [Planctomycetota bacterium]|nr:MAG: aldehyde dehydrogenase [Planctomycetota bacterium]